MNHYVDTALAKHSLHFAPSVHVLHILRKQNFPTEWIGERMARLFADPIISMRVHGFQVKRGRGVR